MSRADDGVKQKSSKGGASRSNGTSSAGQEEAKFQKLLAWAPAGCTTEDVKDLYDKHKGNEGLVMEELQSWWDVKPESWTTIKNKKEKEVPAPPPGRGRGRGGGADSRRGGGIPSDRGGGRGSGGRGRSAPPGGRGGGMGGRGGGRGGSSRSTSVGPNRNALPTSSSPEPQDATAAAKTNGGPGVGGPSEGGLVVEDGGWEDTKPLSWVSGKDTLQEQSPAVHLPPPVPAPTPTPATTTTAAPSTGNTWASLLKPKPQPPPPPPQPVAAPIAPPVVSQSAPAPTGTKSPKIGASSPRLPTSPPRAVAGPKADDLVVASSVPVVSSPQAGPLSASDKAVGPPSGSAASKPRGATSPTFGPSDPSIKTDTGANATGAKDPIESASESMSRVNLGQWADTLSNSGGDGGAIYFGAFGREDSTGGKSAGTAPGMIWGSAKPSVSPVGPQPSGQAAPASAGTKTTSPPFSAFTEPSSPSGQAKATASSIYSTMGGAPNSVSASASSATSTAATSGLSAATGAQSSARPSVPPGLAPLPTQQTSQSTSPVPSPAPAPSAGVRGGKIGDATKVSSPGGSSAPVAPSTAPQPTGASTPRQQQQAATQPTQPQTAQQAPTQPQATSVTAPAPPQTAGGPQYGTYGQMGGADQGLTAGPGARATGPAAPSATVNGASTYQATANLRQQPGQPQGTSGLPQPQQQQQQPTPDLVGAGAYNPYNAYMGMNGQYGHGMAPYGVPAPGLAHGAGIEVDSQAGAYGAPPVSHGTSSSAQQGVSMAPSSTTVGPYPQVGQQSSVTPPPHAVPAMQAQYPQPPPGYYGYYGPPAPYFYQGQPYPSQGQYGYGSRGAVQYGQGPRGQAPGMYGMDFTAAQASSMHYAGGMDYGPNTGFGQEFGLQGGVQSLPGSASGKSSSHGHSDLGSHMHGHGSKGQQTVGVGTQQQPQQQQQQGGGFGGGYGTAQSGSHGGYHHQGRTPGSVMDQPTQGWATAQQYQGAGWMPHPSQPGNVMQYSQGGISTNPLQQPQQPQQQQQQFSGYAGASGSSRGQSWS